MLAVEHLSKSFGPMVAIKDLTFELREREFLCIVGPSGCGKTTLLRCASGLLPLTSGQVSVGGRPVTGPPEEMALVFQEYGRSLYPWLTVERNVHLPLGRKNLAESERKRLVRDSLAAVGLAEFAGHFPWQLSGGMQQRVAIARALAYQPQVLLMDEPFASVDAQTRADLEDLLLRVWQEFGVTILFVTHDIDEAVYLGDRILVLTPRPTEVQEVVQVSLPRPRDQVVTKELPTFAHLRAQVYRSIKGRGAR
jgi:NitT/TauT family transport system ATP-binding protein